MSTATNAFLLGNSSTQDNLDTLTGMPTTLILFGAGLVNVAIWGRKKYRKVPPGTNLPG